MTGWECSPEALFRYFWDRTLAARGKRVWGGVASAAGSDARSRDEGDAGAHRGGAATPQTAPRRRNPLGRTASCSRRRKEKSSRRRRPSLSPRYAKGRTRRPHPFFHGLLARLPASSLSLFRSGDAMFLQCPSPQPSPALVLRSRRRARAALATERFGKRRRRETKKLDPH